MFLSHKLLSKDSQHSFKCTLGLNRLIKLKRVGSHTRFSMKSLKVIVPDAYVEHSTLWNYCRKGTTQVYTMINMVQSSHFVDSFAKTNTNTCLWGWTNAMFTNVDSSKMYMPVMACSMDVVFSGTEDTAVKSLRWPIGSTDFGEVSSGLGMFRQ